MRLAKKEKKNNVVWFCPECALEKTVLLLAYKKQGQSYTIKVKVSCWRSRRLQNTDECFTIVENFIQNIIK